MSARNHRSIGLTIVVAASFVVAVGCGNRDDAGSSADKPERDAAVESARAEQPASPPAPAPTATYQAAPDFTLQKIGGGSVQLSSLRGKVVLVDFWATWCGPCKASIPHLNSLYAAHHEDGLEILGVSLDRGRGNQSGAQLVEAFAKTTRMDYPVVLGDQSTATSFGGVRAIPTAFLIDREGKIRNRYVGMQPAAVMERAVTALLAEGATI